MSKPDVRRRLSIAALAWLVLGSAPTDALARSCMVMGPLCSRWQEYDAIFDGTVTQIRRIDMDREFEGKPVPGRLVTFAVHDRWRGAEGREIELVLDGGFGLWTSTSFRVQEGERYLIFARYWNGRFSTSSCDPSAPYARATEARVFLESLRLPAAGAYVFGRVGRAHTTFDQEPAARVPETVISLTGGGRTESIVPRDGRFEFTGLAPGVYSLAASPVPGMTGPGTRQVSLADARACAQADVYFHHDTSVSGHLRRPDGTPAANVGVELAPSGTWRDQPMRTTSAYTDAAGHFVFRAVPPGEYVVAVNLRDGVAYTPYPRTMYADAAGEPEIVRVEAGHHVGLSGWTLGPALAKLRVRVRLVDEAGRPLARQTVNLYDVTNPDVPEILRHVVASGTDASGIVEFDIRETRRYMIRGREDRGDSRQTRVFTAAEAPALTLVLATPAKQRGKGFVDEPNYPGNRSSTGIDQPGTAGSASACSPQRETAGASGRAARYTLTQPPRRSTSQTTRVPAAK
jgi:hypothetical protein